MSDERPEHAIWKRLDEHGRLLSDHDQQLAVLYHDIRNMQNQNDRHYHFTTEQLSRIENKLDANTENLNLAQGGLKMLTWGVASIISLLGLGLVIIKIVWGM